MNHRIHIMGASGSGTTTLGKALSDHLTCPHYDTDNFYWQPTDPPFQQKRQPEERLRLLRPALFSGENWILSGSLCDWGDVFIPMFTVVVFLWLPPELRMERLKRRERQRYGEAILAGGVMNEGHQQFMEWAAAYDTGDLSIKSLRRHEQWLTRLSCPVLRIEKDISVEEKINLVLRRIAR